MWRDNQGSGKQDLWRDSAQYADALRLHRQAFALFQQLGDRDGEAYALKDIGNVQEDQGHYADALQSYEQSLATSQQIGDQSLAAKTAASIQRVQLHLHQPPSPSPQPSPTASLPKVRAS